MNTWDTAIKKRVSVSLAWLITISVLGIFLRLYPVMSLQINYKPLLHAHSHLAFLGWVFTSLFTLITGSFLPKEKVASLPFRLQFILLQIFNIGMLVSFLIQGYAFFSILFSSLHMITTFWFIWTTSHSIRRSGASDISHKFLFASFFFMILSSVGPLAIPVTVKMYGSGSEMYHNAIYFYLHFQYNGWFIFSLFALFFKYIQTEGFNFSKRQSVYLFWILFVSCLSTYSLSVLWTDPHTSIWITGFISSALQLFAAVPLIKIIAEVKTQFVQKRTIRNLFLFAIVMFLLKLILQFISAFPLITEMTIVSRNFVIGYLHLVLLGIVTVSLINYFIVKGHIDPTLVHTKRGLALFFTGFIGTELTAFIEAMFKFYSVPLPGYHFTQIFLSVLILAGITLICIGRMRTVAFETRQLTTNHL